MGLSKVGLSGKRLVSRGKWSSKGLWNLSLFLFLLLFLSHDKESTFLHHLLSAKMSSLATDPEAIEPSNHRQRNPLSLYVVSLRDAG